MSRKRIKKSIITPLTAKCFLCGTRKDVDTHYVFYDYWNVKRSKTYGLFVPMCKSCHEKVLNDRESDLKLKRIAQTAFQFEYPDKDFKEMFGDYLQE